MELFWQEAPRTSQDVAAHFSHARGWKRPTVITLLARLTSKGALQAEPLGNRFLYRPAVTRESCVAAETSSFLNRIFGGTLQPLVAHFAQHHRLSKKDVAELRELLDQIKPRS